MKQHQTKFCKYLTPVLHYFIMGTATLCQLRPLTMTVDMFLPVVCVLAPPSTLRGCVRVRVPAYKPVCARVRVRACVRVRVRAWHKSFVRMCAFVGAYVRKCMARDLRATCTSLCILLRSSVERSGLWSTPNEYSIFVPERSKSEPCVYSSIEALILMSITPRIYCTVENAVGSMHRAALCCTACTALYCTSMQHMSIQFRRELRDVVCNPWCQGCGGRYERRWCACMRACKHAWHTEPTCTHARARRLTMSVPTGSQ